MLLSAVSILVVAQSSWKIPEGFMNNPVFHSLMLGIFSSDHPWPSHCEGCDIVVVVASADVGASKAAATLRKWIWDHSSAVYLNSKFCFLY